MQASSIPAKFPIPFANSAGTGFIRPIPQASQIGTTNGAASLTDGFPPNCFVAVAAGGAPPFGQDFNGLLNLVTKWNQWQQAGAPIVYDSTFQGEIGGYPAGAVIQITAGGSEFLSTVDNNTAAPAVGAAGWMPAPTFGANITTVMVTGTLTATNAGLVLVNASAGNITITMPSVSSENGVPLPFVFARTDTSANTVTLSAASGNTFLPGGASTFSVAGNTAAQFVGNGTSAWQLTGGNFFAGTNTWTGANTFSDPVTVANATTAGQAVNLGQAQADFAGINGASANVFNVATAVAAPQAVNLGQIPSLFPGSLTVNGYKKIPDSSSPSGYYIEQWGSGTFPTQLTTAGTFPIAFPSAALSFVCSLGSAINLTTFTSCGGQVTSLSQFVISVGAPASGADSVSWTAKGF